MGSGAGCSDEYETLRGFLDHGFDVHYVLPEGGPDACVEGTKRGRLSLRRRAEGIVLAQEGAGQP